MPTIEKTPNKISFRFINKSSDDGYVWSYADLYKEVSAFSHYLFNHNIRQSAVMITFSSGPKFVKAFLGCLASGNIPVPVSINNLKQSEHRLKSIIATAKPSAIVVDSQFINFYQTDISQYFSEEKLQWLNIDDIDREHKFPDIKLLAETPAIYQFTSGSSSTPKGVIIKHENIIANCSQTKHAGYDERSTFVSWLPCHHDMGLIGSICTPMFLGSESTLINPISFIQNPRIWLEAISKYGGVVSASPNFGYRRCIEKVNEIRGLDLSTWTKAINGAEPVIHRTLTDFAEKFTPCGFNLSHFNIAYGMAEATLTVSSSNQHYPNNFLSVDAEELKKNKICVIDHEKINNVNSHRTKKTLVSSGTPVANTIIKIVDADTLHEVTNNTVGEFWLQGPQVSIGYIDNPELTKSAFNAKISNQEHLGDFYRTGDLGFKNDRGEIFVTGRLKDLIIIRGENYYPQDFELLVEFNFPDVVPTNSAAFSIIVGEQEKLILVIEVKTETSHTIDTEQLKSNIRTLINQTFNIETYDIAIIRAGTITKTTSGKISRPEIKNNYILKNLTLIENKKNAKIESKPHIYSSKNTQTKEKLLTFILLKIKSHMETTSSIDKIIDENKTLSAYGFDSIKILELFYELENKYSCELPVDLFFQKESIIKLSESLGFIIDGGSITTLFKQQRKSSKDITI